MSADAKDEHCAGCGIVGGDEIKLKKCACKLVKYCGVKCQKAHRKLHKRACKKRAAELRDELLFKQPESSHLADCPICSLPAFVTDAVMPIKCEHMKRGLNIRAHSVANLCPQLMTNMINEG